MIEAFTPTQANIMQALAQYKFLTTSQLLKLKVTKQRSHLSAQLALLWKRKRPLVKRISFGFIPKRGRLENFYHLTSTAKKILTQALQMPTDTIKLPRSKHSFFTQDYAHRKHTIDCEIAFHQAAKKLKYQVLTSHRYFDSLPVPKTGKDQQRSTSSSKNRRISYHAATRFRSSPNQHLIADAVFLLQTDLYQELYLLEMYNGRDTRRVIQQLRQHIAALSLGSPSITFNLQRAHRVLCVFEHQSNMEAVKTKLRKDSFFSHMTPYFFFKTLKEINDTFFDHWTNLNGELSSILGKA